MSALDLLRRLERQTRGLDDAPAWIRLDADQKVGRQMRALLPELIEVLEESRMLREEWAAAGLNHAWDILDAKAATMETEA